MSSGYGYNYNQGYSNGSQIASGYADDHYNEYDPSFQYNYQQQQQSAYGYYNEDDPYSTNAMMANTATQGYSHYKDEMYDGDSYGGYPHGRSRGGGEEEEEEEDMLLQPHGGSASDGIDHDHEDNDDHDGIGDDEDHVDVDDDVDFDDPRIANLPRILMMGPRRAGKTSIQRVVFHKMSPHETLFRLEATQNLERSVVDHTPLCRFTIWDFPGDYYGPEDGQHSMLSTSRDEFNRHQNGNGMPVNVISMMRQPPVHSTTAAGAGGGHYSNGNDMGDNVKGMNAWGEGGNSPRPPHNLHNQYLLEDTNNHPSSTMTQGDGDGQIFARATALIFVLDAQDEPYDHVLQHLTETVKRAARANPHIAIEVFINKVDGELFLSDEAKYDCRRDVMQQVSDELADAGVMPDSVQISYHLTSIYDHSVFDAFSRVVQKLIPQLPTLENLLNVLVSTCAMEKAYLFDVASKLYISTDSSPVDMQSVELCSDMIDVVLDVSGIYGMPSGGGGGENNGVRNSIENMGDKLLGTDGIDSMAPVAGEMASLTSGGGGGGDLSKSHDVVSSSPPHENDDELLGTLIGQTGDALFTTDDLLQEVQKDDTAGTAYDSDSASVIRLSKSMILYLKEVDTMLALVCLTRSDNFRKRNLINYNIRCLKKALRSLVHQKS